MESIIQKTLKLLLDKYGADYNLVSVVEDTPGHYRANIDSDHPSRLIGKKGDTITSLQILLKLILPKDIIESAFISIDVDGYRKKQEEDIISEVEESLQMMEEENLAEIKLRPMTPYFRRVAHLYITNNKPSLSSDSIGAGRSRAVRVFRK